MKQEKHNQKMHAKHTKEITRRKAHCRRSFQPWWCGVVCACHVWLVLLPRVHPYHPSPQSPLPPLLLGSTDGERRGRRSTNPQPHGLHLGPGPCPFPNRGCREHKKSSTRVGDGRERADRGPRPPDGGAARGDRRGLRGPLRQAPPPHAPGRALQPLQGRDDAVDDGPGGAGRQAGLQGPEEEGRRPARLGAHRGRLRVVAGPPRRRQEGLLLRLRLVARGGRRRLPALQGPPQAVLGAPGELVPLRRRARRRRAGEGGGGRAARRGGGQEAAAARGRGPHRQLQEQAAAQGDVPALQAGARQGHRRGSRGQSQRQALGDAENCGLVPDIAREALRRGDPELNHRARHRRGFPDQSDRLACRGRHEESEGGIQGEVQDDGDQGRRRRHFRVLPGHPAHPHRARVAIARMMQSSEDDVQCHIALLLCSFD